METIFSTSVARALVLVASLVVLTSLGACGGEQGLFSPDCPAGQIKAQVDGETGCYVYCAQAACPAGFACIDTVCLPSSTSPGGPINNTGGGTNNGANNGGPATNNAAGANNAAPCELVTQQTDCAAGQYCDKGRCRTPEPSALDECQRYCDLIWGSCLRDNCTGLDPQILGEIEHECIFGSVTVDDTGAETGRTDGCLRDIRSPAVRQQNADFIAREDCQSLSYFRCGQLGLTDLCSCEPPQVGGPCTGDDDCEGGDLIGACIPEIDENDQPTGFPGGYCVAGPCDPTQGVAPGDAYATDICGESGACLVTSPTRAICVDRCTSHSDCRSSYVCNALTIATRVDAATSQSVPDLIASCDLGCASSDDCALGFACHLGACVFPCHGPALEGLCDDLGGECTTISKGDFCLLP